MFGVGDAPRLGDPSHCVGRAPFPRATHKPLDRGQIADGVADDCTLVEFRTDKDPRQSARAQDTLTILTLGPHP